MYIIIHARKQEGTLKNYNKLTVTMTNTNVLNAKEKLDNDI